MFRKALLEDKLAQSKSGFPDVCSDTVVNSLGTDLESPTHSSQSSGDSLRSNYGSSKSRSLDISDGNATPSEEVIDESAVLDEDVTWENGNYRI